MSRKWALILWVGGFLALFCFEARGGEQWLAYRVSREPWREVSYQPVFKELVIVADPPEGIRKPRSRGKNPIWARWTAAGGDVWLTIDQSGPGELYDTLYVDSDRDGKGMRAFRIQKDLSQFGPVKILFDGPDGPVSYHLLVSLMDGGGRKKLTATSAGWYEGNVRVGGKRMRCVLVDYNVNGRFDDVSLDLDQADRIGIGREDQVSLAPVGRYVQIGDRIYRLKVAGDGAHVRIAEVEDEELETGKVIVPKNISRLSAGGENGFFTVRPVDGIARLPVGRYRLKEWEISRKDSEGKRWTMIGKGFSAAGIFEVETDGAVTLAVGEAIRSEVYATGKAGRYSFSHRLTGNLGEKVVVRREDGSAGPRLTISNDDRSFNETLTFECDAKGDWGLSWQEPKEAVGPMRALAEWETPFEIETKPYLFRKQ